MTNKLKSLKFGAGSESYVVYDEEAHNKIAQVEGKIPSLEGYALKTDLEVLETKADAELAHTSIEAELSLKADKSELPVIPTKVSTFENDCGYLTEHQSLEAYETKEEAEKSHSSIEAELSLKADKSELPVVPTVVSAFENDKGYLTEHQDISFLATKEEVAEKYVPYVESTGGRKHIVLENHDSILGTDTEGTTYNVAMISKWNVADFGTNKLHLNLNSTDDVTVNDNIKLVTEPMMEAKGYLTEHQDISFLATKEEVAEVENKIPSVPTVVSAFTNDAGYLTEHQSLEDYETKAEAEASVKSLAFADQEIRDNLQQAIKESTKADSDIVNLVEVLKSIIQSQKYTIEALNENVSDLIKRVTMLEAKEEDAEVVEDVASDTTSDKSVVATVSEITNSKATIKSTQGDVTTFGGTVVSSILNVQAGQGE